MADWFVCQYDVFSNELDPDALGVMLTPMYDANHNIMYCEHEHQNHQNQNYRHNGIRRVKSRWGVDPDIKQYDIIVETLVQHKSQHGLPPLHSSTTSLATQTYEWIPTHQQLHFMNSANGFRVENSCTKQQLVVERDINTRLNHVKFMHMDMYNEYTHFVGKVIGIRIHKLVLFNPFPSKSWFSKYVTAHTAPVSKDTTQYEKEQL